MLVTIFKALIIFLELVSITQAKQIAAYWGQGTFQESLASYCEQENMDIAIISFVNNFQENEIFFNFGNACDSEISCPSLATDINKCQSLGVKVLVSLGGANGQYGVSENDVSSLTDKIFQDFGPDGTVFPGGLIGGFDLDIESGEITGYVDIESVKEKTKDIICEEKFGGFMVWDVHFAMQNDNYLSQLKNILNETANTLAKSAVLSDDAPTTTTSDSQLINTIYTEFLDGAATLTTTAVITDGMTTTTTNDSQLVKSIHTTLLDGATTLTTTAGVYVSDVEMSSFFISEPPAISSNSRITQTLEPSSSKNYIYVTGVQQLEGGHVGVSIL